jgi:DNA polymerase lambda
VFNTIAFLSSFTEDLQTEHQQGPASKLVVLPPAPLAFVPTRKASSTAHHNDNQNNHIHTNTEDPLAEFYEKARAERDQAVSRNV